MIEPKRPANVPEGTRWGHVTLGTGELVEAIIADDEVWIWDGSSFDLVWDSTWSQARFAFEWEGDARWSAALWYQCRRLYEAEGDGYVELREPEPENTDRTHPDSGSPGIDWEAFHRELFARAVGSMAADGEWDAECLARSAKRLADAALAVYREGDG